MMISKILFPTDGSELAKKAVPHVIKMAEKYQATVLIVNVYQLPSELAGIVSTYNSTYSYISEMERNLREYGDEITKECQNELVHNGINCQTLLLKGEVGPAIADTVESEKCDLVVLSRRGLSTVKSLLLGSVSDYLVHHVKCPVLLVN
jgi:nucleotide-binding universal stress UspA family protein